MRDTKLVNALRKHAADRIVAAEESALVLKKEIEKLRAQLPRWIPVTERLPKQMMRLSPSADVMRAANPRVAGAVLCFCKDGSKKAMRYDFGIKAWILRATTDYVFYFEPTFVTHWMPLPETPEVE